MKFVSKVSNFRVVLKPGQPAEPLTGRVAVSGDYVKFEDGIVNIEDEDKCERMKKHLGFGSDFQLIEEEEKDPYSDNRKSSEPEHNIMEIDKGTVGKSLNPAPKVTFTPKQKAAMKEMISDEAKKLAMEIAPELAKEIIKNATANQPAEEAVETPPETDEVIEEEIIETPQKTDEVIEEEIVEEAPKTTASTKAANKTKK